MALLGCAVGDVGRDDCRRWRWGWLNSRRRFAWRCSDRQLKNPTGKDAAGIGELRTAAHVTTLVELPDLGPAQPAAEKALCDSPQRVALADAVRSVRRPPAQAFCPGIGTSSTQPGRMRLGSEKVSPLVMVRPALASKIVV